MHFLFLVHSTTFKHGKYTLSCLSYAPLIPFNHICQVFILNTLHWSVRILRDEGGMEEEGRPREGVKQEEDKDREE